MDISTPSLAGVQIGDSTGGVASLTQYGATLTAGTVTVGAGGAGLYRLYGGSASLSSLWIASSGNGTLDLSSSGSLTVTSVLKIGLSGFTGSESQSGASYIGQGGSVSDVALYM